MQKDVGKFGISDKRGRVETSPDPYLPLEGLKEPAYCRDCHAVYRNKRWQLGTPGTSDTGLVETVCPACRKTAEGYAQGVMTLSGDYLWKHEAEILNMLRHAEERVRAKNPLERILRMEREGEALVIETTAEKLVEHLGRALHKAHRGELRVNWGDGHEVCRVNWERMN